MPRDELAAAVAVSPARERRKRARIRPSWLVAGVIAAALAAAGWWYLTSPIEVTAEHAFRGPVADVVYATGFVEPHQPVSVSSRVTAPVADVLSDEGGRVTRGQPLAILDSADLRQAITELSARRVNAEQDEGRALALYRQGFLARAARDKAVATASSARASEAAARARLNQYTIRSGIPGIVLRRDVEPGDLASPSRTLFQIGDPSLLRVTATVDERDIPLVRRGAKAMMSSDAFPNRIINGRVYDITPGGNPEQRAFRVRILPDSTENLPVGLTLEVNILISEKPNALLVPGGAVRQNSVWAVENGRARKLPVATGIHSEERVEITRGLAANACVITDPPDTLKDGKRVTAKGC